jgi:hypothetical protein
MNQYDLQQKVRQIMAEMPKPLFNALIRVGDEDHQRKTMDFLESQAHLVGVMVALANGPDRNTIPTLQKALGESLTEAALATITYLASEAKKRKKGQEQEPEMPVDPAAEVQAERFVKDYLRGISK